MSEIRSPAELDQRWDLHTSRQIEASKGGVLAVTVLNSGSWLALLSQAGKLSELPGRSSPFWPIVAWGLGAFFGTLPWLMIYLNTMALGRHDFDRDNSRHEAAIDWTIRIGLLFVAVSLACFLWGLFALAQFAASAGQPIAPPN